MSPKVAVCSFAVSKEPEPEAEPLAPDLEASIDVSVTQTAPDIDTEIEEEEDTGVDADGPPLRYDPAKYSQPSQPVDATDGLPESPLTDNRIRAPSHSRKRSEMVFGGDSPQPSTSPLLSSSPPPPDSASLPDPPLLGVQEPVDQGDEPRPMDRATSPDSNQTSDP